MNPYVRVISQITIDDETRDVFIRFKGSSRAIVAKALEFSRDSEGQITNLLLDRLVHEESEDRFEFQPGQRFLSCFDDLSCFAVSGCVVTEMSRL